MGSRQKGRHRPAASPHRRHESRGRGYGAWADSSQAAHEAPDQQDGKLAGGRSSARHHAGLWAFCTLAHHGRPFMRVCVRGARLGGVALRGHANEHACRGLSTSTRVDHCHHHRLHSYQHRAHPPTLMCHELQVRGWWYSHRSKINLKYLPNLVNNRVCVCT